MHFIIMQFINIGVAYGLTEFVLSIVINKKDLAYIRNLVTFPSVALLYVTYNDVLPEILYRLKHQIYPRYDIFILDDSTNNDCIIETNISGFSVIRRDNRKGFKAGAINNWLSLYGDKYDYFVVADSDSVFESDFIERMVKYAEHPTNWRVAIFQSKINNWNNDSKFARTITAATPLSNYFVDKLANECDLIVSWGHNNLHRTRLIKEIGGFDERFVSEDFATGLKLIDRGYKCKLVDVISYDMTPENVNSYIKRHLRWAKQNLELLNLDIRKVPFNTQLHLFMSIYQYLIWIVYFIGIIIVIYAYDSSLEQTIEFAHIIFSGEVINSPLLMPLMLMIFYVFNFTFLRLPLALTLGISIKNYCTNIALSMAVSYCMMLPLIRAQIETFLGGKATFNVTNKRNENTNIFRTIRDFKYTNIFILIVLIGLIRNPLALVFNFVYLIPLILSPFIVYAIEKD
jgi:cellulose synthase/poly-beta-1,6-N-acetylglucosamine synthase-like glycosyltransferase